MKTKRFHIPELRSGLFPDGKIRQGVLWCVLVLLLLAIPAIAFSGAKQSQPPLRPAWEITLGNEPREGGEILRVVVPQQLTDSIPAVRFTLSQFLARQLLRQNQHYTSRHQRWLQLLLAFSLAELAMALTVPTSRSRTHSAHFHLQAILRSVLPVRAGPLC